MIKNNNSGFTLIEIVLAIAILGIALVPILSLMINSSGIITYADEREMAILLAQQAIEDVKSMDYESITSATAINIDPSFTDVDLSRYPDYSGSLTVVPTSGSSIKDLQVDISWTKNNNNKVITLKTKVADR